MISAVCSELLESRINLKASASIHIYKCIDSSIYFHIFHQPSVLSSEAIRSTLSIFKNL